MSKTPQSPNNCSSPKASHPSDVQASIVFCEKDEEIQTPLMPSPDTNVINAIASSSPTVKRPTPTILFQNIKKRKQHSSVPMKINLIKKHRKKSHVHGSLFSFLRTDRLNTKLGELSRKPFQTCGIMKKVYNNFSSESKVWFPFLHLKELLSDDTKSKEVLTVDNHRLLFEDFLE